MLPSKLSKLLQTLMLRTEATAGQHAVHADHGLLFSQTRARVLPHLSLNQRRQHLRHLSSINFLSEATNNLVTRKLSCPFSSTSIKGLRMGGSLNSIRLPPEVQYEDLVNYLDAREVLLIDVREPAELQESGYINGCINIPLGSVQDAFRLHPDEFEKKYKVPFPDEDAPIICYCKIGIRSGKASGLLSTMGFTNTSNYKGSYAEWMEKTKEK